MTLHLNCEVCHREYDVPIPEGTINLRSLVTILDAYARCVHCGQPDKVSVIMNGDAGGGKRK